MKLYRNLTYAVVDGLEAIIGEKRYADKVIEKLLKRDPRWGARDRRFIAETIYDIIRWYRLFCYAGSKDYWHLLACWLVKNNVELPDWQEFRDLTEDKIRERFKAAEKKRILAQSIPDWLDELAYAQLGDRWEKELIALNETAPVVLRANTLQTSQTELVVALKEENIMTQEPEKTIKLEVTYEKMNDWENAISLTRGLLGQFGGEVDEFYQRVIGSASSGAGGSIDHNQGR